MDFRHIIILVMMLATLGVLLTGLGVMMKGGEFNKKYGNKLMVARVGLQGLTILLLAIFMMTGK